AAVVCEDFGGADEGEVERVEEQHHVLADVVSQREVFLDGAIGDDGCSSEIGGFLTKKGGHLSLLTKGLRVAKMDRNYAGRGGDLQGRGGPLPALPRAAALSRPSLTAGSSGCPLFLSGKAGFPASRRVLPRSPG